jgi:radical SAM protein with 4Fe4S-binding SPASM domain
VNILLTTDCSLDCNYCFARALRNGRAAQELTLVEFETILDSLDPRRDWVRLMGGEPTLHSKYPEVVRIARERGFRTAVFTNGLQEVLRTTHPYLPDQVLLNLNDWTTYTGTQQEAIRANLSALGRCTSLAYTILEPDFNLDMHRRLIMEASLHPLIRLGLAQPVIGGDNAYLKNTDLPAAHKSLVRWARILSADGIRLSMDCGFMRCEFSDADIEVLVRAGTVLNFDCSPTLDVGPGLRVWRCYTFSSGPGIAWAEFKSVEQMQDWFMMRDLKQGNACENCEYENQGWCRGGCLARRIEQADDPRARHER